MVYNTRQLAEKLGICLQKAQELCRSQRIAAVNLSVGKRPTWVVSEEAFQAFINPPKQSFDATKTRRRSRIDSHVKQVF